MSSLGRSSTTCPTAKAAAPGMQQAKEAAVLKAESQSAGTHSPPRSEPNALETSSDAGSSSIQCGIKTNISDALLTA